MITLHAETQYNTRILPTIGRQLSFNRLDDLTAKYRKGKHYIRIANLGKMYYAHDGSNGDTLVAIVLDGSVVTIMLSKQHQRWADGTFQVRLIA